MQLLSLLMSVILLVLLIWQSWAVADLRRSLRNAEDQIYDLENEVQEISGDVARAVEEAANPIQDWEVHPSGINQEQKTASGRCDPKAEELAGGYGSLSGDGGWAGQARYSHAGG